MAEVFLDHLAETDVDAVAIDDGDRIYAFDLVRYRTADRVGHDPYPMKRVPDLEAADVFSRSEFEEDIDTGVDEWNWLTTDDLQPTSEAD